MKEIKNKTINEIDVIFEQIDIKMNDMETTVNNTIPKMKLRNCKYVGTYVKGDP